MSEPRGRVTLRIDRVVADRRLDPAALEAALRREIRGMLEAGGHASRQGGHRDHAEALLPRSDAPTPGRIAAATAEAVRR